MREIVVESYDATIGSSRTELIYDGDRLVGTKQFGSRLPVFTRYEYGRDEATFSDKISFYTSVGEEPERSGSVYVIEDAKITKRVGNGMVFHYTYQDGRVSRGTMLSDVYTDWNYTEYTYENGNLRGWVSRSMRGDEEVAGGWAAFQFEYDSIPNNANIDLFTRGFSSDQFLSVQGLNITGIRNRNLPSKVKDLKDNIEWRYTYELEDGYVTGYELEKWVYEYGNWELYVGGGTTRYIYE